MAQQSENQPDPSEPPVGLFISLAVINGMFFLGIIVLYALGAVWLLSF